VPTPLIYVGYWAKIGNATVAPTRRGGTGLSWQSRLSLGSASQNAECEEDLHEDQGRVVAFVGCVAGGPAYAQDLGPQIKKFGDGIYAVIEGDPN
jgi:hypothetical protein